MSAALFAYAHLGAALFVAFVVFMAAGFGFGCALVVKSIASRPPPEPRTSRLARWTGFLGPVPLFIVLFAVVTKFANVAERYAHRRFFDRNRDWSSRPVVVPYRDLPAGTVLTYESLAQRPLPSVIAPEGQVVELADVDSIVGARLLVTVSGGHVIYRSAVSSLAPQDLCGAALSK